MAAAFCASLGTASATGWVALYGLTASDYQTEFDRWTSAPYGLRLTCVSGYDTGAGPRFAAIWTQQSGPGYYTIHQMTAAQFQSANAEYQSQDFNPVFISGFTSGGVRYYNAIWEYQPGVSSVAVEIEMDRPTMTGQALGKIAQGYTLTYVATFTSGGTDYYAAIWTPGSVGGVQCAYGRTGAQYQSDFNSLTSQGYRLVAVTTALDGTTPLYSAVFRQPVGAAWYNYASISAANFSGETLNAYYTGYRPSFISVYSNNGAASFNATWTWNGGMDPVAAQPIYRAMDDYMSTNGVPGLSLAIARNGRLVFAKGFGQADQAANVWVHPDHRFRIASVSKPFTATAMLRLRDGNGGTLSSLTNLVFGSGALLGTTYGTQPYSTRERAITVRHLLSHTTGWTDDGQLWNNAYGANHKAIIDWQLDNDEPTQFPGIGYQYQNIDFCVAGRVIEQLSGMSYEPYVQTQVQGPCGITDMELGNQTLAGRKANEVVYYQAPGGGDPYVTIDPHRMDANGGWIGRPIDLLLFLRRIDGLSTNTDIISGNRFAELMTGTTANMGYSLGMILSGSWFGHNGCMDGTVSFLVHRTDGFDFAVVCNLRPPNDSCAWNLRAAVNSAINAVPASAWPSYDLFPSANLAYDAWAVAHFPSYLRAQLGLKESFWGPAADFEGDGIANLLEAYFNFDPTQASTLPYKPLVERGEFVVRWTRSILSPLNGVQLQSLISPSLQAPRWTPGPVIEAVPVGGLGLYNYETRIPMSDQTKIFERFQATAP